MAPHPSGPSTKLNSPVPFPGVPQDSRYLPFASMIQKVESYMAATQMVPSGATVTQHAPSRGGFVPPTCQSCLRAGSSGAAATAIGAGVAAALGTAVRDDCASAERSGVADLTLDAEAASVGLSLGLICALHPPTITARPIARPTPPPARLSM